MPVIQVFSWAVLAFLALSVVYHIGLASVAILWPRRPSHIGSEASHAFAILIPAHDEEATIGIVLGSCAELDYPRDKYEVFVIADNCTDATARIAREAGATCLERSDPIHRGKGQALAWAFERVLPRGPDAVVVLDADCRIDRGTLRAFDQCLADGDHVIQANYVASNPDESCTSYAAAVANAIENDLFYTPKSRLGLAVFLRGTGMAFRHEILERYPWRAGSIVEDAEYSLELFRGGIDIRYLSDVSVRSDFPVSQGQLDIQRSRWVGGGIALARAYSARLIWEGLVRRKGLLIDSGWTLLILNRSLIVMTLAAAIGLGLINIWLSPGPGADLLLATALTLAVLQLAYFALGIVQLGLTRRRVALMLGIPAAAFRMLSIAVAGVFGTGSGPWLKTPRTGI